MKRYIIVITMILGIISLSGDIFASSNIASLSDLHPKFYDGRIGGGSACVNESYFGAGWNPGEEVTANFDKEYKIDKIKIYLGELGETGTGYVEAKINGRYEKIADFEDFGVDYNRETILLSEPIITDSIRFHMTSGGGSDRNLCFSEIEIWGEDVRSDRYNEGFEAGKQYCINNPSACGLCAQCGSGNVDGECASFNMFTNTLHIPCLDMGESYWLDLMLINSDPVRLEMTGFGRN